MRTIAACLMGITVFAHSFAADSDSSKSSLLWKPPPFSKVVAYQFDIPSNAEEGYFTLLRDKKINGSLLAAQERKRAVLSEGQTAQFSSALIPKKSYGRYACHTPHHIFVFYSAADEPVAAVEICFECRSVHALPSFADESSHRQDLVGLAKLVSELGLWTSKKSVEEWVAQFEKSVKGN